MERVPERSFLDQSEKAVKIKDYTSGKLDPKLSSFMTPYQPTVLEKVVNTKTEEILYQKTLSSLRVPPKVILRNAWQVQHEDHHQRGTSTGQPFADEEKVEPKIDSRIQGMSHAAEQEEGSRRRLIKKLVHQVKNHSDKLH